MECVLNRKVVGFRWFDEEGHLSSEWPLNDGLLHGTMFEFDFGLRELGMVTFAEPYRNGLAHGKARQWSNEDGTLIGTYSMKNGTGLDLWRNWSFERNMYVLSEARFIKSGRRHGFAWWLNEDQKSVYKESHYWEGLQHGILREWNRLGKLKRGYPKYWVHDKPVSKRQYLRARIEDAGLPAFSEADNVPRRKFPSEVLAAVIQPDL